MLNGCIFLISARKNLLPICLKHLQENYNHDRYPILVFYHGTKYDDDSYRRKVRKMGNITFHHLKYELPSHISETDLFYHKKDIPYVKKSFPPSRIGYLHANYFWNNFMNHPALQKYEYLMRIDDDSWFKKPIKEDLFEELVKSRELCASGYTWNHVHGRVLDTRVNFYKWVKDYVSLNGITPKNSILQKSLEDGEHDIIEGRRCNLQFHHLEYLSGNCNIYNRKLFDDDRWRKYLEDFNRVAGGFRYRWGDCEVISIFCYLFHTPGDLLSFRLKERGLYDNKLPDAKFVHNGL